MKSIITPPAYRWVAVGALTLMSLIACKKYDDSELRSKIASLEKDNTELRAQISNLKSTEINVNNDIEVLNQLVSTLETGNYIKSVTTLEDGSGYIIAFADGESIFVKNGKDGIQGTAGTPGQDGKTPEISVGLYEDVYYWKLNGEWLLDEDGNKLRVTGEKGDKGDPGATGKDGTTGATGAAGKDGVTPQFKIVDGNWMVSYDGGASWSSAGSATASNGIVSVTVDEATHTLTLTLSDGTKIPITYGTDKSSSDSGEDATTETSYIELDKTSETIGAEGGTITVKVNASGAYTASCPESWITIARGTNTCTITVAANTATAVRKATITLTCGGISKTVTITQSGKSTSTTNPWDGKMEVVLIKAGTFTMGSPTTETDRNSDETQHTVTLTKDFYMGKYPVTNAQYSEFLNAVGCSSEYDYGYYTSSDNQKRLLVYSQSWGVVYADGKWKPQSGYDNYPVLCVTWYGANEYAKWIGGSLPTEAQWEYACRAGSTTVYFFGDSSSKLGDYAWYSDNSSTKTHPVGQKKPNAWGLYDMYGNVWEWCADWKGSYPSGATTDPTGPATGTDRIIRGGMYLFDASYCRSAIRLCSDPDDYLSGFRVCFPRG